MQSVKFKVSLYGIRPEMVIVHSMVASVFAKHNTECVITSGVGMKHSKRSLHYVGLALDYRTKGVSDGVVRNILQDLKEALPVCDIIHEHKGEPQEHLHIEMDPHQDEKFQEDKLYYKTHGKWRK